ncbi:MAG: FecR family protein [Aestuariivirga sp.]
MQRLIAAFIFVLSTAIASQAMAGAIGTAVATYGSVNVTGPSGSHALNSGSQVFEHDKITVTSGNAQIELRDGTKLVLGPNSTLVLENFLMKGGATAQSVSVDALRGTFRFITGKSPKSAYKIQTSNATIGIRGTGFDFWVAERTGVALLKGSVNLCAKSGGRSCISLEPNCSIGVAGDPNPAHIVKGMEKTNIIERRLPYLMNQTSLRSQFHLSTTSCERDFPRLEQSRPPPTKNGAKPR